MLVNNVLAHWLCYSSISIQCIFCQLGFSLEGTASIDVSFRQLEPCFSNPVPSAIRYGMYADMVQRSSYSQYRVHCKWWCNYPACMHSPWKNIVLLVYVSIRGLEIASPDRTGTTIWKGIWHVRDYCQNDIWLEAPGRSDVYLCHSRWDKGKGYSNKTLHPSFLSAITRH